MVDSLESSLKEFDSSVQLIKDNGTLYGWFKWRPYHLQKISSRPLTFLVIICCCAFVQEFTVSGIVNLCVSSVEKQFRLTSTQTGAVISAYDIAFLAASAPISYAGGRSVLLVSKIRYLTTGMICLALGSLIFASPQFFSDPYEYRSVSETCQIGPTSTTNSLNPPTKSNVGPMLALVTGNILHGIGSAPLYTLGVAYIDENSGVDVVPLYLGIYYAVSVLGPAFGFMFGGFILTFYVDSWRSSFDHNDATLQPSDPNWVGAWWLGFVVCALAALVITLPLSGFPSHLPGMLSKFKARADTSFAGVKRRLRQQPINDNVKRADSDNGSNGKFLKPAITTLIAGIAKVCACICRKQAHNTTNESERMNNDPNSTLEGRKRGGKFSSVNCLGMKICDNDVMLELRSLFKNVPYIFVTFAGAADGLLLNSFAAFLPKYLEMQFGISAKNASFYVGILTVPAGVLGMFLGGYLIKRFNVGVVGMFRIIFWSSMVNLLCMFAMLTTCPETKLAGVNYESPYLTPSAWAQPNDERNNLNERKIEFTCNKGCNCEYTYDPVCASNNIMYYSACHAGCLQKGLGLDVRNYSGCHCIPSSLISTDNSYMKIIMNGTARLGSCSTVCGKWKMVLFLGIMFFGLFLMLMIAVIAVNCTLKCVEGAENSLAMGVQWVFVRLLGTIPGPIIFGKIIDRNCLFWEIKSNQPSALQLSRLTGVNNHSELLEYGSCKLYTNPQMGLDLFLLSLACKMVAQLFYGIAYYSYWFYSRNITSTINLFGPSPPPPPPIITSPKLAKDKIASDTNNTG